jgi:hypothetical protein
MALVIGVLMVDINTLVMKNIVCFVAQVLMALVLRVLTVNINMVTVEINVSTVVQLLQVHVLKALTESTRNNKYLQALLILNNDVHH